MSTPSERRAPSLLDPVLRHAERLPEKIMYSFEDSGGAVRERYTYETFLERSNAIAAHLVADVRCREGDRLILAYPPGVEMLCAFFACVRAGCIPVPVPPPHDQDYVSSARRMDFVARDAGAVLGLTDRAGFWSMKVGRARAGLADPGASANGPGLRWIVSSDIPSDRLTEVLRSPSDVLFLQYTSGSTQDPRGVMVSHRNVLANAAAIFHGPPIGVSWLPQYHDMGLIGSCLFVPISGGSIHLMSPFDFMRSPLSWLRAIGRHGATASAAPSFAYELCLGSRRIDDVALETLDLSSLELLMNGAEPVRAEVFEAFRSRFAQCGLRPDVLCGAYGLAEHTLAVSNRGTRVGVFGADAMGEGRAVALEGDGDEVGEGPVRKLVSCGRPVANTVVRIVAAEGAAVELQDGHVGEIWVDGPSKCLGYWGRPELSTEVFEARLEGSAGPDRAWLRTGDLGFVDDGELFVCGRSKDLVIVRGRNYYPQDIEALVAEDPAVRSGAVVAFAVEGEREERLVVVAELRGSVSPESPERINRSLLEGLGLAAERLVFIRKRSIPKTSSGKIRRAETAARWRDGLLDVVSEVSFALSAVASGEGEGDGRDSTWGTIEALDRTFRRSGLTGREPGTLAEAGIDSLGLAELAVEVESHLRAAGVEDLAGAVDLRWLQRVSVSELYGLMRGVLSAETTARMRFRNALAGLRAEQLALEQKMMAADTRLDVPASAGHAVHSPSADAAGSGDGGDILLTGGTGFFGPFLLRSLLLQRTGRIHVLVRAPDEDRALSRIERALHSLGRELGGDALGGWRGRVVPVPGDLALPRFGLSDGRWERLSRSIDGVVHNGARVNYLEEYAELRGANVLGTREVLRFAGTDRPKSLDYVSTTFVFGWSTSEFLFEREADTELSLLDFGYSQSKWVAEQLVMRAMADGLSARVFRPALIAPALTGAGEHFDIAMRLVAFMVKHGVATTAANQVSLSPADIVADNVVAIAGLPDTAGQVFHVTRDVRSTMKDVTDRLARLTGARFRHYPLDTFVPEVVSRCTAADPLFPLLNFLVRSVDKIGAMEFKEYDNRNYRAARDRSPHGRPDPPLDDVVEGVLRFLHRHGLSAPRAEPSRTDVSSKKAGLR